MSDRKGFATHLIVAALAFSAGALGTYLTRHQPAATAEHVHDQTTTHGEYIWVKKPTGDSVRAYVAYPERRDKAPAVIVIHENQGLTTWEPTVADKLAGNGYVAAAVDLPSSMFGLYPADSGRAYIPRLTPDGVTADLNAVYEYLNGLGAVRKDQIGVIGFCWGGGQTFRYATNNPKLKAAVVCYGPAPDTLAMPRIGAKILGVYGEADARINSQLPTVADVMKRLGKSFAPDSYPGTGHGFLKPGRRGNDTDQPDKAWAKILAFFQENLAK
ncbi:MAG: dienelactone hydrolase family protein [Gemmatimonadales bacterium]|nr:dienelactone hydrolase family protein [Gemmatimonadales bacterium]